MDAEDKNSYMERLKRFKAKATLLGLNLDVDKDFKIDYDNMTLLGYRGRSIKCLVLPPAKRIAKHFISYWTSEINELILPDMLEIIEEKSLCVYNIKELRLPNGLRYISPIFTSCPTLEKIHIGTKLPMIGNLGLLKNLKCVEVDPNNPYLLSEDNIIYSKDKSIVFYCLEARTEDVILPDTVTHIAPMAFAGCKIRHIELPDSVEFIHKAAFLNTSIETMHLPKNLIQIGEMAFNTCFYLQSVYYDGDKLDSIGDKAFANCVSLKTLNLGTSKKEISSSAFENSYNIDTLIV